MTVCRFELAHKKKISKYICFSSRITSNLYEVRTYVLSLTCWPSSYKIEQQTLSTLCRQKETQYSSSRCLSTSASVGGHVGPVLNAD